MVARQVVAALLLLAAGQVAAQTPHPRERASLGLAVEGLRPINPARIGRGLDLGPYWGVDLDFAEAQVWYFSPDAEAGGDGSFADPFPAFGACTIADSSGATPKYFAKYDRSGNRTHVGVVDVGDVAVLMPGDHGRYVFSQNRWRNWIAIVGMRGAVLRQGLLIEQYHTLWEGVTFEKSRTEWPAEQQGTPPCYDNKPFLVRYTSQNGNLYFNYANIYNRCTFTSGMNPTDWTAEEWAEHGPRGLLMVACDSMAVVNSRFTSIGECMNMEQMRWFSVARNTAYQTNGDFINSGTGSDAAAYLQQIWVAGNTNTQQYATDGNHLDGIMGCYNNGGDGAVSDVMIENNFFRFTDTVERGHQWASGCSSQYGTMSFGGTIGVGFWTYANRVEDLTIRNNVIITTAEYHDGITVRNACTDCAIVNNTVINNLPDNPDEAEMADFPPYIGFRYHATSPLVNCVVANNVAGAIDPDNLVGVTYTNNYEYGAASMDPSSAGFTAFGWGVAPKDWNLAPTVTSPLTDTGSSVYATAYDLTGKARPIGLYDDIGAYETLNAKNLLALTLEGYDDGSHVALGVGGTAAFAGDIELQAKIAGATFAAAGTYETGTVVDFEHTTDYLSAVLPDSFYVRGRLVVDEVAGPWDEPASVYVEAAEGPDSTPPVVTIVAGRHDSLGAGGKVRILFDVIADEDWYSKFTLVEMAAGDTIGQTPWSESTIATADTGSVIFDTGDDAVDGAEYLCVAWGRDAAANVSTPDTQMVEVATAASDPDTTVYIVIPCTR